MQNDELVLCIPSRYKPKIKGDYKMLGAEVIKGTDYFLRPRCICETDSTTLQVIPYAYLNVAPENATPKVFTYRRMKGNGEKRLSGNLSIGVGGHINPVDMVGNSDLFDIIQFALAREVYEELGLHFCNYVPKFKAIMITNSENPVDQFHIAVIYEIRVSEKFNFTFAEDMASCGFLPLIKVLEDNTLEQWSVNLGHWLYTL